MLIIKEGDLLDAKENLICHQVNTYGVMGGGLAKQIATKYPKVNEEYQEFVGKAGKQNLLGWYQVCKIGEKKYIINCFSQKVFDTDYEALIQIFTGLLETCKVNNFSIAIPYKYGCGIANGDWDKVSEILTKLSEEFEVNINVYKKENI